MDHTKPRGLHEVALETYGQSLSSRFEMRLIDQARSGHFGSLKSRNFQMRNAFEKLAMLISHRSIPLFVFGERGTGKQRLVNEFFSLQSFLNRLDGKPAGRLKVLRGDYVHAGFRDDWSKLFGSGDFIYIDSVELMPLDAQHELHQALISETMPYRVILSSTVALSLRVAQGQFLRELFAEISEVAIYLPSLIDRGEDLTALVGEFIESMSSSKTLPSVQIMDLLARADLPKNIDDLETLVRCLLSKKYDPAAWTLEDFPPAFRVLFPNAKDLVNKHQEKSMLHRALLESGGNHAQAARILGMNRMEFLQKLFSLGIR